MKMGTILPDRKSMELNDKFHRNLEKRKQTIAKEKGLVNGIRRGGETQYHEGNFFRVVGSDGRIRVFRKEEEGDYFVRFE